MNKDRIKIVVILCATLVFISLGINEVFKSYQGLKITIVNNTDKFIKNVEDKSITNLEFKYVSGNDIKTIRKIEVENKLEFSVNTNEVKGEDAIILVYKDRKNNIYEKTIVGYLEKGYNGEVEVYITKINDNDDLNISVDGIKP